MLFPKILNAKQVVNLYNYSALCYDPIGIEPRLTAYKATILKLEQERGFGMRTYHCLISILQLLLKTINLWVIGLACFRCN